MSDTALVAETTTTQETLSPAALKRIREINDGKPALDITKQICLKLNLKKPGVRKRVDADQIEVDADRDTLSVSKDIYESEVLKTLRSHDVKIRKWISEHGIACSYLSAGVTVIPNEQIVSVDAQLQIFLQERVDLREMFRAEYPSLIKKAETTLRALFDESDYPPVDTVCASIDHDYRYFTMAKASALASISADIAKREEARAIERAKQTAREIDAILMEECRRTVGMIIEKLTPGEDGKTKRIRESQNTKFKEFFQILNDRNISGNKSLAEIAKLGMDALGDIDVESLRKSDKTRDDIVAEFKGKIEPLIDAAIINTPKRAITLD